MKQKFLVTGMSCASCSAHVEKAVSKVPGVISVSVSLLTNSMTVDFDQQKTAPEAIIQAVQQAGYGASLPDSGKKAEKKSPAKMEEDAAASMKKRLIWSMVFMIPLFYLAMGI